MSIINVWIAIRDDAQALIHERLTWDEESQGEYSGPVTDRQAKLFGYMADRDTTQRLFRTDSLARVWTLWSVYFDLPGNILQKVKAELDQLALDYPNHIKLIGAWHWDGRQVGTQYVYGPVTREIDDPAFNQPDIPNPDYQPYPDEPDFDPRETIPDPTWVAPDPWPQIEETTIEIIGTTGEPTYPIHARLLEFMPDTVTYDANGDETSRTRPTIPSDINLGLGQTPRLF